MSTLHGYKSVTPGHNGEFHFAVLNLLKSVERAHQFPGRNKFPHLKEWDEEENFPFEFREAPGHVLENRSLIGFGG
jgi:hypothetical protein